MWDHKLEYLENFPPQMLQLKGFSFLEWRGMSFAAKFVEDSLTQSGGHLGSLAARDAELGGAFARAGETAQDASFGPEFVGFSVASGLLHCEQSFSCFVLHSQAATQKNNRQ